ncbi:MAG: nucleotidyltransferase domain-containing protein, partial [bacterium]
MKKRLKEEFPDVEIMLYGSKTRGDDEEFSDIDLLISLD